VRDDAILLDLQDLDAVDDRPGRNKRIQYDEASKVVACSPSVTGKELNEFLMHVDSGKGRFFAGGHCPDVGLGGFLLQGGMGWNCKVGFYVVVQS
jgi:FAD/FMN-containing dehydrogenase